MRRESHAYALAAAVAPAVVCLLPLAQVQTCIYPFRSLAEWSYLHFSLKFLVVFSPNFALSFCLPYSNPCKYFFETVKLLQNKTPFEVLYNKKPEYTHLRVLGCLAFATNPAFTSYKFSPRGVPCVFLGYPSSKKGYRLLNMLNMQVFVPGDVTFKEDVFPFQTNAGEAYMHPILNPELKTSIKPNIDNLEMFLDDLDEHYQPTTEQQTKTQQI